MQTVSCAGRLVVAYSGGVDSHVLLHVLITLRQNGVVRHPIVACHINHQLQVANTAWRSHCEDVAANLGVQICCIDVDVDLRNGASPEEAARVARYQALHAVLESGDGLLTAHHADDQVETLLLQLMRGAGVDGLASMATAQIHTHCHYRPMLGVSRAQILHYAHANALQWIEDPSNGLEQFSRNYLRTQVLPLLRVRWPGLQKSILRTAHNCAQSAALNRALAGMDAEQAIDTAGRVDLNELAGLDQLRQINVLRHWIRERNGRFPSRSSIKEIFGSVIGAREDAAPEHVIGAHLVKRYRRHLYWVERDNKRLPDDWERVWHDTKKDLPIPELGICVSPALLGKARVTSKPDAIIRVRIRRGGEILRAPGRQGKSLKKLFQEKGVPPWYRYRLPLVFCDDNLIAVVGIDQWSASQNQFTQ